MFQASPDSARDRLRGVRFIYFDIDGTLWDHQTAQAGGLGRLAEDYGWPADRFVKRFMEVNERCWRELVAKRIDMKTLRHRRFAEPLAELGIHPSDEEIAAFSERYLECYVADPCLLPGTGICRELAERYALGILSNGATSIQAAKLRHIGMEELFEPIIFSEDAPAMKPHRAIFEFAAEKCGHAPDDILYIGDDPEADMTGALGAGWHAVWIRPELGPEHHGTPHAAVLAEDSPHPQGEPDATITRLEELRGLLLDD